ncbi:MAG: septum formation protein Maf [Anaerolineae bacterium]|nr:MAG: septum formation protein Maf [Anaerolineae bacterium]
MSEKIVLVLASNSPRRRQLLTLGGWMFHTTSADLDESRLPGEAPAAYVRRLARTKAQAVASQARPESIIIGADTAVVDGEDILGKPSNMAEAEAMLRRLRGRVHQVYTAIAVYRPADGALLDDLCVTDVPMRAYTDDEIRAYVATGDPLDKAGGYAIQHRGFRPVETTLNGCYAGVMGMPMCHLVRTLKRWNILPQADVPRNCQQLLRFQCPVYRPVLRGEQ